MGNQTRLWHGGKLDGFDQHGQTLSVNMQQNAEAGSATTWASSILHVYDWYQQLDRRWVLEAAMNDAAANNRAFTFQMAEIRITLWHLAPGMTVRAIFQSGTYQCVTNLKNGGNAYLVLDAAASGRCY